MGRKAKTIRKQLREIILQGNNDQIQELFLEIVIACRDEFTEDNEPTLAGFLTSNLYKALTYGNESLGKHIIPAMIEELSGPIYPEKEPVTPEPIKLRLLNTYKFLLEKYNESKTLYEWSDGEKSYFTHIQDHHYIAMTGKYCLGHTLEDATTSLKKMIEENFKIRNCP